MYLVFDTETTGLPRNFKAPITEVDNWPRVVQLAWQLHDLEGNMVEHGAHLVQPDGFNIPFDSEKIHGISTALAKRDGKSLEAILNSFDQALAQATFIVGHNVTFDLNVLGCEYVRLKRTRTLGQMKVLDSCTEKTAALCKIPGGKGGKMKLPTLSELHRFLFQEDFSEAHNATADVEATTRCFLELIRLEVFTAADLGKGADYMTHFKSLHTQPMALAGLVHQNLKAESKSLAKPHREEGLRANQEVSAELEDAPFVHLHNHTQYTLLQSTSEIKDLVQKAGDFDMPALAVTDSGNMMAAFLFEKAVNEYNSDLKQKREVAEENGVPFPKSDMVPIIGCEFNVCQNHLDKSIKDSGYQIVIIAKNKNGYQNLVKLSSIAYTAGFYYVPRIDKKLIEAHKEDLIVLSGGLLGEISSLILNVGEAQAEQAILWWKAQFGADFYLEINRHNLTEEDNVNETLIFMSQKHQVKLVAANNTFYIHKEDAPAQDVLLCVKEGQLVSTPKGRGRGYRPGLPNDEYYFKSPAEMKMLFADLPEAILNIAEVISKCEHYALAREVLLPKFDIPEQFVDPQDDILGSKNGENAYLKHLTLEGAVKRYGSIGDELSERLEFELETIKKTGYPGYFLICQDFCSEARKMGVSVGPGRGSAAGSAVAYCIGITNVDPLKYDLLFERFLNPDRISLPDIDIDFDDEGRSKVIDYVIQKYGSSQVAQIITYGTMAAKSAIKDTARVMDLPLPEAIRLTKLLPDITLKKLFEFDDMNLATHLKNNMEAINNAKELRRLYHKNDLTSEVLHKAKELEGSVRNTGIHACGVIITPDEITKFVPVATAKDSELVCTQYDNSVAESAGLLKMDFLGLKTLTLIKDSVRIIHEKHGILLDPDTFPEQDEATFKLFQRGETVGIFQYESVGMQKNMREMKPTEINDLIALNALYRPGPMEYIPLYIKRKHGEEPVVYDLDDCEEYLSETYGITVYQEQVMLLSQKLSSFTKGEADTLRKAMGKKDAKVLMKMKPEFIRRGIENSHDKVKLEKIWKDWEAFALYAFNKSHATCYTLLAYQTAYLKANYPAEYMAAVLSNNMSDIKQVTFFMEECRRMGIEVLGPDVNESNFSFTVNDQGAIRFGLGAIKGIGDGPVNWIMSERNNGKFTTIFDLSRRINHGALGRGAFQSLVYAGALDSFKELHRAQYFFEESNNRLFLDTIIKYGQACQNEAKSGGDIFGELPGFEIPEPKPPVCDPWPSSFKLSKERESIGIFISGHPLDDYKVEINSFCTGNLGMLEDLNAVAGRDLFFAAVVVSVEHRLTKNGDPFGTVVFEDFTNQFKLNIFRENYLKFKHFFNPGVFVTLRGRVEVPRFRTNLEFVLGSMELIQDLREKRAKLIELRIQNNEINQDMIDSLNQLFVERLGPCTVHFVIYDEVERLEIQMPSKSVRIALDPMLYKELTRLNIDFKLN